MSFNLKSFLGVSCISFTMLIGINTTEAKAQETQPGIITFSGESGAAYYGYILDNARANNTIKKPPVKDVVVPTEPKKPINGLPPIVNPYPPTLPRLPEIVIPKQTQPTMPIPQPPKPKPTVSGKIVTRACGWVSAYSPGNSGTLTASGKNVHSIPHKFVASRTIPFGAKVYEVSEKDVYSENVLSKTKTFFGVREDWGPAEWTGHDLDLWFASDSQAINWGRKYRCWVAVK